VISGIGARLLLLKQYFNYPTRISPMTRMVRSRRTDSRDQRDRRQAFVVETILQLLDADLANDADGPEPAEPIRVISGIGARVDSTDQCNSA
jgi:hypothetical protein